MRIEAVPAVIAGGATGMGYATAKLFAEEGARVAVLGRRADLIESRAQELGGLGIACDISDAGSVEAAFESIEAALGTPRILVNCAADGRMNQLLDSNGAPSPSDIAGEIVSTNVLGPIFLAQAFASRIAKDRDAAHQKGAVIINASSIGADDGVVGAPYAASKAAVNAMALVLARELSRWAIRVMTIAPGGIDTEMYREGESPATRELVESMIPWPKRLGLPEEFAALALHVCENDYLNGSVIRLDGGMRIPFVMDVGGVET